MTPHATRTQILAVIASALGYFVDLYDIVIFGVVRVASLADLGLTGDDSTRWGIILLNLQMLGMLVGGVLWGVIADRLGRRFALLATITLYSLANLANAFVTSVEQYAWLRLLAGIGLAGELGAGVTLVAELLPKHRRGYGTTVIAFLGLLGALTASFSGDQLPWRWAYALGGGLGLLVLALRWRVLEESSMFEEQQARGGGQAQLLLTRPRLLLRYLAVIAVGVPIWYASALFVNFAPEYGRALQLPAPLTVSEVLRWQSVGLALGSAMSGIISEWLHSRRRVIAASLAAMAVLTLMLLLGDGHSVHSYCVIMGLMGLAQGYWTVFLACGAEQFGTNVRATVATSVPNFVRAATVPVTLALGALMPTLGIVPATLAIGAVVFALASVALIGLRETYGIDLDYAEN
ncbi:Predicted arabinose efflux permease, MFS family [Fontimonas thermophila]|uniref:Predicted arabinose efflux permease, MFS family n=1 Tax=Fontimonas thermophila TaxID=1076937 RepID=A0A1I2KAT2_9GAMM|nr:MFS transporter [Fontimonas thermophila]SFF62026.1 Predicted arabinose efflux permease, MFS family [Fontimonas thermophila]